MLRKHRQHGQSLCEASRRACQHNRNYSSISRPTATSLNHERFDSKGRLIIETTPPRQPEYALEKLRDETFFDQKERRFAATTRLPISFFSDISSLREIMPTRSEHEIQQQNNAATQQPATQSPSTLKEQLKLLASVRQLEEKLEKARKDLEKSMKAPVEAPASAKLSQKVVLTKQDYLNMVDLYFYSYNSRFSPEAPDASPNPVFISNDSFVLSSKFDDPTQPDSEEDEDPFEYASIFRDIESRLKQNQLREVATMQVFVDLLLDEGSSNRALYAAYHQLPQPGVAYLPKGVIRLLLQRMSTPWVRTQASRLRYMSLIEDMQAARLPITLAEWSSAIYLTGRAYSRIDQNELGDAFEIWRRMENEAGVRASGITFNILFDIAVRRGKFALGETIMREMQSRGLRLNRLGRVSLMYYHGLRGDGDGVRKTYHDFVEAGEIVDTTVLNCVIASLVNAGEPVAAEQIYQRMKDMQTSLTRGWSEDGEQMLFRRHPEPGPNVLGDQMASNDLGRLLARSSNLKELLPENHAALQNSMPLTPNFTTFRIMLAYHASVSGDLDRATVLLKEMLQDFDIPLFPIIFQLLFKGFAIHNPSGGPSSSWTRKKLDQVWAACKRAIKESNIIVHGQSAPTMPILPELEDVNKGIDEVNEAARTGQGLSRTLSMWEELVIDLATFPRERLKRLHRYHSSQFDEDTTERSFSSPFFQQTHYSAPQPDLDEEEGEYSLPDQTRSSIANTTYEKVDPYADEDPISDSASYAAVHQSPSSSQTTAGIEDITHDDTEDQAPTMPYSSLKSDVNILRQHLRPSKPMICWLLRAYARVTNSRSKVEEVYDHIRTVWQPKEERDAEVVMKVLLRCLRDCDRLSGRS